MNAIGIQHYKEHTLNNMTQEELLFQLLDELVNQITRGGIALEDGNFEMFDDSMDRSFYIIRYLDDTLDRSYPISHDLHRMYDFFSYDIMRTKSGRKKDELARLRPMIVDLRDTFRAAGKAQEGQNGSGGA